MAADCIAPGNRLEAPGSRTVVAAPGALPGTLEAHHKGPGAHIEVHNPADSLVEVVTVHTVVAIHRAGSQGLVDSRGLAGVVAGIYAEV